MSTIQQAAAWWWGVMADEGNSSGIVAKSAALGTGLVGASLVWLAVRLITGRWR